MSQGWSFSVCHDPSVLALTSASLGADGATVNDGGPPDFFTLEIFPEGWSVGVVISMVGATSLPTGTFEIGATTYDALAPGSTTLCPCPLGQPATATVIVYSGQSVAPILDCQTVVVEDGPVFIRGDSNFDGGIDLADGIRILASLFTTGMSLPCHDSGDVNGDAVVNIADAVAVLMFLFSDGAPPVAPFPECGAVPGADCSAGVACP